MKYSRRDFGKFALGSLPVASAILADPRRFFAAAKPNSKINGVQIGTITYSYRSMPDQSAEATLKYAVDSGISAVELMDGPTWAYAREKTGFTGGTTGRGGAARGAGRPGGPGGAGPARGGAAAGTPSTAANPGEAASGSWNGQPCPAGRGPGGFGGGGNRPQLTPEQIAAQQAAAEELRKWQLGLSMDIFKDLKKMYD